MSRQDRRRERQERRDEEHLFDVEQTLSDFKVLFAHNWEPLLLQEGYIALITSPVHETVRAQILADTSVTAEEAFGRVNELNQTDSGRVVLRDANERFEKWINNL